MTKTETNACLSEYYLWGTVRPTIDPSDVRTIGHLPMSLTTSQ